MTDKKPVHNEEFSWTVHDFSKPKKAVEEVKMEWPKEPERPRRNVNLDEPISFDIDVFKKRSESEQLPKEEKAPEPPKMEEPKVSTESSPEKKIQELEELTEKLRKQQNMERQAAAQSAMNSSRQEAAAEAREESLRKADPFFDFSHTNIAFQDLLDQEYAKLQKRKEGVPYVESQWRYQPEPETQPEPEIPSEPEPAAEIPVEAPVEEPAEAELPESPEDALERMIMEGTQNVDPSNDATIQVDLSAIKKAAAQRYGYETAAELDGVPVELMEEIIETTEPETPEEAVKKRNTMTEMEKAREEYFKMLDQELSGVQVKVEVEVKPNTTVERHTTILDSRDVAAAEAEDNVVETTAEVEVPAPEVSAEEPKAAEPEEEIVWPLDPSQYEEEEERGGFFSVLGKILLAVIALVIALEIGALAILYFAPDSAMAGKVYVVQEKVLGLMDSLKNGDDGEDDPVIDDQTQADQEGEAGQEEPNGEAGTADPVTDTAPMTDKTALIQTQIGKNKNIKSITANDALTYKSGANYGIEDLNDSKPIENNLWYRSEERR